jgi:hypothetical protein
MQNTQLQLTDKVITIDKDRAYAFSNAIQMRDGIVMCSLNYNSQCTYDIFVQDAASHARHIRDAYQDFLMKTCNRFSANTLRGLLIRSKARYMCIGQMGSLFQSQTVRITSPVNTQATYYSGFASIDRRLLDGQSHPFHTESMIEAINRFLED